MLEDRLQHWGGSYSVQEEKGTRDERRGGLWWTEMKGRVWGVEEYLCKIKPLSQAVRDEWCTKMTAISTFTWFDGEAAKYMLWLSFTLSLSCITVLLPLSHCPHKSPALLHLFKPVMGNSQPLCNRILLDSDWAAPAKDTLHPATLQSEMAQDASGYFKISPFFYL